MTKIHKNEKEAFEATHLIIDTETTGLSKNAEILQLAVIDGGGKVLYNSLFKPLKTASWPEAERINHISPAKVKNCPAFADELPEIQKFFDGSKIICGYNVMFDLNALEYNGLKAETLKIRDVMKDFMRIIPEWCKLTDCADFLGWKASKHQGEAHDALYDCEMTRFAAEQLLDRGIIIHDCNLIMRSPTPQGEFNEDGDLGKNRIQGLFYGRNSGNLRHR